ncbi:Tetraspanin-31-B [Gossypium australe]|uniref:Tetraspanin-31-B n=1 Tax=Gossypium australe TaxID=47621 RepID=A0A5B6VP22_9ROSI|nr:Tetraspanin-31-B [Gossypium australe]
MYSLMSTSPCNYGVSKLPLPPSFNLKHNYPKFLSCRKALQIHVNATNEVDAQTGTVVQKTAATFAPRASTATKNPAVPGTTLYTVFEIQGYVSLLLGGALSFNLIFPSNEPDIWRLMGMWSIWMFTIPSLRARDCSKNEKEALNYLFLIIPLLNVIIPFFWKSFAVVWSADIVAFFALYAWKLGWLQKTE